MNRILFSRACRSNMARLGGTSAPRSHLSRNRPSARNNRPTQESIQNRTPEKIKLKITEDEIERYRNKFSNKQ